MHKGVIYYLWKICLSITYVCDLFHYHPNMEIIFLPIPSIKMDREIYIYKQENILQEFQTDIVLVMLIVVNMARGDRI